MTRPGFFVVGFAFVLLSGGQSILAQPTSPGSDCASIAEEILQTLDETCTGLERNFACYGYRRVTASFTVESVAPAFVNVGDQTPLITLKTLTPAPFDPQTGDWGIALMKMQANIPNTLPGQSVTVVLVGDAEVENAVPSNEALALPDPTPVHTAAPTTAFSAPTESSEPLSEIGADAELLADVVNEDGTWARIAYQDRPAWVLTTGLREAEAVSALPALRAGAFTPMQAFYFRTGIGQSACEQAPDLLMVQGPEHFAVDIRANGADIRIGSTAVFKGSNVIALSGEVVIFPGPDEITLPAGYWVELCPSEAKNLGTDGKPNDIEFVAGCAKSPPSPFSHADRTELGLDVLQYLPPGILNYPIVFETCTPEATWIEYTVQSGDTLSSIAARSDGSVTWPSLMEGNCLTDTVLHVGQTLRVPFNVAPPAPPETGSTGWGGCGSCSTCGDHPVNECVLSPERQCLWDPSTCMGASASPGQPPVPGQSPPSNRPPTARFTPNCPDYTGSCNFDGAGSSDPDGSVVSYSWNFGDDTTGSGASVSHTYAATGGTSANYTVTLTVTDNQGAKGSSSQTVTVTWLI